MKEGFKIILSHPTGNANVRALAEGFAAAGLLHKFYTCVALFRSSHLFFLTRFGALREFEKRIFAEVLKRDTHSRPFRELARIAAQRLGIGELISHEKGHFCIGRIYQDLDLYVSGRLKKANVIYSYEDGALQSFQKAKVKKINCLYDLPIGYWRVMHQLLQEERRKNPKWAMTLTGFKDSAEKLRRKEMEIELADEIFVASTFSAETLKKFPGKLASVHIVPYGFPPVIKKKNYIPLISRRLNILFIGGLSQRKGISYMFEAIDQMIDKVELTVVGQKTTEDCEILNRNLVKHNWIPRLPHPQVIELMESQDVLVFPSLFEGFGLVITEAMSQGTPVITTRRTCGADLITDNENGWLVEAGSTESLVTKLEEIFANPDCLRKVGEAAMATAEKRPWEVYGGEMAETIVKILEKDKFYFE